MPALSPEAAPSRISTGAGSAAPASHPKAPPMTTFTKLEQIKRHLRLIPKARPKIAPVPVPAPETGKRVQKNLSILETDAARLTALAKRDGLSQARLLSAALDAYEKSSDTRVSRAIKD